MRQPAGVRSAAVRRKSAGGAGRRGSDGSAEHIRHGQIGRLKTSSRGLEAWHNPSAMTLKLNGFWSSALAVVACRRPFGPDAGSAAPRTRPQPPTFRVQIDAVTMDVIVKDDQGRFVPDLKKDEFEIYEDGVKQDIASMTMSHGGRVTNVLEAPPPPPPEGIILPPARKVQDTSGRIFLFFVDDLHLQFQNSGRVRELFKKIQQQPDSRRRPVRHRLERTVVDLA